MCVKACIAFLLLLECSGISALFRTIEIERKDRGEKERGDGMCIEPKLLLLLLLQRGLSLRWYALYPVSYQGEPRFACFSLRLNDAG